MTRGLRKLDAMVTGWLLRNRSHLPDSRSVCGTRRADDRGRVTGTVRTSRALVHMDTLDMDTLALSFPWRRSGVALAQVWRSRPGA
jgi:hypothetical protein